MGTGAGNGCMGEGRGWDQNRVNEPTSHNIQDGVFTGFNTFFCSFGQSPSIPELEWLAID
jgi:hypothetical protein